MEQTHLRKQRIDGWARSYTHKPLNVMPNQPTLEERLKVAAVTDSYEDTQDDKAQEEDKDHPNQSGRDAED